MAKLLENQIFSSLSDDFIIAASEISKSKSRILIVSEPSLVGSIALSSIECALLDSSIPYRRRFSTSEQKESPIIKIHSETNQGDSFFNIHPFALFLQSQVVEGLRGRSGDSRKGPLTVIPQAFALSECINPDSHRLRRMKPWILSGNWLANALDNTYDAVYSTLRDYLSLEGSVKIVPFAEVPDLNLGNYPWLEVTKFSEISDSWYSATLQEREKMLFTLVKDSLQLSIPSTSRLEELVWNCVIGNGWDSDLASQILLAKSYWDSLSPIEAASKVADQIVRSGTVSSLQS